MTSLTRISNEENHLSTVKLKNNKVTAKIKNKLVKIKFLLN